METVSYSYGGDMPDANVGYQQVWQSSLAKLPQVLSLLTHTNW